MKTMKHFLFASLALVLLLSCIAVGPANAQGISGKFTLPFAACWGGATLPAGDYVFTMDRPAGMLHLAHGRRNIGMVLPQTVQSRYPALSSLLVVPSNGVNFIRELRLAGSGVVLTYPAKPANRKAIEERETRLLIPITAPGE